jgi:hypothetical protein
MMGIRVVRFALVVASIVASAVPGLAGSAGVSSSAAQDVRIVSAAPHGPITGYTCLSAQTTFRRIGAVRLLADGQELARIDDPEKTSRLTGGTTLCFDTAQIPNGSHQVEVAFTAEDGRVGRATIRLSTDNPPFRLTGVFPDRPFYRGGQTIEMSLEATHTGLTVAVDFSKIDSGYRTGSETVVPQPDGRYLVRYALSPANSRAVGLYPISVRLSGQGKSRLYADGISIGLLPRRDSPLSLTGDGHETRIFAPLPRASESPLEILSLGSSAVGPVRVGETVRISGFVAASRGAEHAAFAAAARAVTIFYSEMNSDGFSRMPVELTPCSDGPPGCLGRFAVDLELTPGGAESLMGLETLNLRFALEDARGGISGAASLPVPAEPVLGAPPPPSGPFHVSGKFQYRAPNPIFVQNGPNDINMLSQYQVEHPVRFATVRVIRDSDGVSLAFTRTNKYGDFAMDFSSPLGGLVHVAAYTDVDTAGRKLRVYDTSVQDYTLSSSSWVPQFEPDKHLVTSSSQAQWLIFDNLARAIDFVSDFAGKSLPRISVLWEHGYAQGLPNSNYVGGRNCTLTSYYNRTEGGSGQLHLTSKLPNVYPDTDDVEDEDTGMHECVPKPGEFLGGDLDDFDSPVQVHEFGHFAQHHMNRAESCTHGVKEPKSAWCEGEPTAMGQTILGSRFYYDRTLNGNGVEVLTVESVDQNTGGSNNQGLMPVCGPYSDGWVWRLLYDFFDPKSSSLGDIVWIWAPAANVAPEPVTVSAEGVHFGSDFDRIGNIKAVMDVLAEYMSVDDPTPPDRGPAGPEFVDFLDGWIAQGNGQQLDILTLAFNVMRLGYDFGFLGGNLCHQNLGDAVVSFFASGDISNGGVANSLEQKAAHVQAAREEGRLTQAANLLSAFEHEVSAQRGRHVSDFAATVLQSLALGLLEEITSGR